ncbi:hypothetical protein [Myroides sp. DF42-4-2]|nr:hypothetical protein [Myroides sp. DF42-4-2]MDM1407339.1 hypothetical protein [Myroides sp. DF42-4-2]
MILLFRKIMEKSSFLSKKWKKTEEGIASHIRLGPMARIANPHHRSIA